MHGLRLRRTLSVRQAVGLVVSLLVLAIAGILADTVRGLRDQESDAGVIDLAGRQRMLQEKHLQELLLSAHGLPADYPYTRNILNETSLALLYGGSAVLSLGQDHRVVLPAAPTKRLQVELERQGDLLGSFEAQAENLLGLLPTDSRRPAQLSHLRVLNDQLVDEMNQTVKLFSKHSQEKLPPCWLVS